MCRGDAAMVIAAKYWSVVLTLCGVSVVAVAQQAAIEAPTGFDTPTLVENPGSQSVSNGIAEPAGDSFALDQQIFELTHDVNSGLGPVFNARACAAANPFIGLPWTKPWLLSPPQVFSSKGHGHGHITACFDEYRIKLP